MATIFFSLAGEGRGHATRVRAVVEQIRDEHRVVLFAPGVAFEILSFAYGDVDDVTVYEIPGLYSQYTGRRMSYFKTFLMGLPYYFKLGELLAWQEEIIRREQPDLIVTDFEPSLPRAAKRCGVPFISFDHQHSVVVNDISDFPWSLRLKAWFIGTFVKSYYSGQRATIVSSFYDAPLKPGYDDTIQVGVLLRPEILAAEADVNDHVLVYLRRFERENLLDALRGCGRDVHVYGVGARPSEGRVHFFDVNEERFVNDLANCHALISNAGNQLVGEAFYLRKPFLALPEPGNFEQEVNAHYIQKSGGGACVRYDRLTGRELGAFLERVPSLRAAIDPVSVCGNEQAVEAILDQLPIKTARRRELAAVDAV